LLLTAQLHIMNQGCDRLKIAADVVGITGYTLKPDFGDTYKFD